MINWEQKFDKKFTPRMTKIINGDKNAHWGILAEISNFIKEIAINEYRRGYNACLKDEKIPNEFGQKSL